MTHRRIDQRAHETAPPKITAMSTHPVLARREVREALSGRVTREEARAIAEDLKAKGLIWFRPSSPGDIAAALSYRKRKGEG